MARYRLRFLLQEFDLGGAEVVLGRSPDCHITIEDPLVSRRHARIDIEVDPPTVEDLGSRNGVRVNGLKISGAQELNDGDRVRLGTQELVFYVVSEARGRGAARTTGFMAVCHACGMPFPEQSPQCPHCGDPRRDDDTISGLVVEPRRSWTFQLLGEVIERAITSSRAVEAERIMRRAAREVDERLATGETLDAEQVTMITSFALRLAKLNGKSEWVHWALNVHRDQTMFPAKSLFDCLEELDLRALPDAIHSIDEFRRWAETQRETLRPSPDAERMSQLARLSRTN